MFLWLLWLWLLLLLLSWLYKEKINKYKEKVNIVLNEINKLQNVLKACVTELNDYKKLFSQQSEEVSLVIDALQAVYDKIKNTHKLELDNINSSVYNENKEDYINRINKNFRTIANLIDKI